MLEPHDRTLLFDVLRPPEGHALDAAIATTFTLDLLALLTAPVAFSLFDVDDHRELLDQGSLPLLESLRRYADKITVFCQAGYIGLPKVQFPQLEFLERSIVQCRARVDGALFHPKMWLLRFSGEEGSVIYRFACLTRNLTFDRCWDTVLTLEGPLRGAPRAVNRPLSDFVRAIPELATTPVDDSVAERAVKIADEVRRVDFAVPDGFESYAFHPMGIAGSNALPFDDRPGSILAISPFISDGGLQRLMKGRARGLLVSRPESLEQEGCRLDRFRKLFVLAREAHDEPEQPSANEQVDLTRGLHAKCIVIDAGSRTHVFTGSANATERAFSSNVEMMVELVGPKARFGIDALFTREKDKLCLGSLLEEFQPQPRPLDEEEEGRRAAIERTRLSIALRRLVAHVEADGDEFGMELRSDEPLGWSDTNVRVRCWPVTMGQARGVAIQNGQRAVSLGRLSFEALTSFMAFEVSIAGDERSEVFVVNALLEGAPADRRERLLRSFITDRRRLVRFLLFLLAEDAELADMLAPSSSVRQGRQNDDIDPVNGEATLLETLLKTLHRSPQRLDAVARLLDDLRGQPDAAELLPTGFDQVWEAIWAARRGAHP